MNNQLHPTEHSTGSDGDELALDIRDHGICCVIPEGASFTGTMDLPGGAIIAGTVEGRITCASGSLILVRTGKLSGEASAPNIYIEGNVTNPGPGRITTLKADLLIAVSNLATGRADLLSRAFSINATGNFEGRLVNLNDVGTGA